MELHLMWSLFLMLAGLVALVIGAELLVRGASHVAIACGISPLIIGLTVVAFGTSAPELAVSMAASLDGRADIAVGNVVGSNIFNVLFILGLSALVVPLTVHQKLVRFDVPLMIAISAAVWLLGHDGTISRLEGSGLFTGLLAYTVWCILIGKRESREVRDEYTDAFGDSSSPETVAPEVGRIRKLITQLLLIPSGLVLLVFGAEWLVDGATVLARGFGISELVIGLTIVAGGTSLPELATSIVAAFRGERDIAVGNIVGSNLFNILGVLGLSAMVGPRGIPVANQVLQFDIPVMIAVAAACLPIFFTGHQISRWEGSLFLGYYLSYTVALILVATSNSILPEFQQIMLGFVVPLTTITLAVVTLRSVEKWRWGAAKDRFAPEKTSMPHIVIIGGGFGGLSAARQLTRIDARVTLIDRRNFHLFQPLLYQVATGSLSPANISAPLRQLLRRQWNVEVRLGEVEGIDLAQSMIHLADGQKLSYNHLIVAVGARHSYFGHPHWEHFAPGLKTIEDATEIRRRILSAFEAAEFEQDPGRRRELLTFVIVGGGPTGVELAGSLSEIARHTMRYEFRAINPAEARVLLIEAADRVLTMYPKDSSSKALESLNRLGVETKFHTSVIDVDEGTVTLDSHGVQEIIRATTVLWAAGVAASPLTRSLAEQSGAELDRSGRIAVLPDLTLQNYGNVYIIGDMALSRDVNSRPLPGIAPVAIQQGVFVGQLVRSNLAGHMHTVSAKKPFRYRHQGNLATIGRSAAVADFGWCKVSGFAAWFLWLVIHVAQLNQFHNRVLVFVQWLWSFVTFGRSARLITGPAPQGGTNRLNSQVVASTVMEQHL